MRAISGYGESLHTLSSIHLDKAFSLCEEQDDLVEIVEELHQNIMRFKLLDFRMYY
jgi:hypothetical protein